MSKRRSNLENMMGCMQKYMGFLLFIVFFLAIHTGASSAQVINIVSDDFNSINLNTSIWTPINPLGDATFTMTGTGTSNAALNINIPGGTSHDAWTTNNAPRVMQTVDNTDFQIEAKFLSIMTSAYQTQGIIIEQDSNNYIRFDFIRTSATETYIYANSFSAGIAADALSSPIASGNPLYLRINRTGDQWKQFYSYDKNNWNLATSFSHVLTMNSVGVFAANVGVGSPAPSFTAKIDYFFNSSSPVVPEDQSDTTPPNIDLWYGNLQRFGQLGVPQKWVNILGNVNDESGVTTLNYSLNGASARPLTIGPDGLRLQSSGDFNIEINRTILLCGNNTLVIKAVDSQGNMKSESMTIQYSCNNVWPKTYSINWSDVTNIQDVAQIVDGKWIKETNSIRPAIMGFDRFVAIGDITWDDFEITAPITLNSAFNPTIINGNFIGFVMRWPGHYDAPGQQPSNGWYPLGAFGGYLRDGSKYKFQIQGNALKTIADDTSGKQLTVGVPYIFKMRAQTSGANSTYSLKVWEQGTVEPSVWLISGSGLQGELKKGSAMLMIHNANASIGNVIIKPGPFNDTSPPLISNVLIMPEVSTAIIRWNTNESATSKVSYGRSTAYENGSVVDGTLVTSHSITLTGLKNGTQYHIKINSTDPSGNSANTTDMVFTTPSPCSNISDDFNASTLDSCWTVINPKSDATINVVGGSLSISVPGGQDHNAWTTNEAPRIMKYIVNKNFEIDLKFKSQTTLPSQTQGLIIQQDINNYLRFDINTLYASTTTANIFAANLTNGRYTVQSNVPGIPSSNPMWMRVNRTGNTWKQYYSNDGQSWILAANFNYPMIVSSIGPFAANALGSASPAFTSLVDHILDTSNGTLLPPSITVQPVNATVSNGSAATFSVVAVGTPPLIYQWKKNGVNITSATGPSYTTPIVNLSDNGMKFSVVVSNGYGSVTSNQATLIVTSTPPSLLSNSGFESGTTPWSFYTNGAGTFSNDASGAGSPHAGHVAISVQGTNVQLSQFGLVLEPNTKYSLTFKAYSSTGHDLSVSLLKNVAPYTNYGLKDYVANLGTSWNEYSVQFTASGFSTTVSDGRLMFWLAPYDAGSDQYYFDDVVLTKVSQDTQVPPTIITQPASQTKSVGQTAVFSVSAIGTSPLNYQWKKNGTNITDATSTSYSIPAITLDDNGARFSVLVSNIMGSVTSNEAVLSVGSTPEISILSNPGFESGTTPWSFYTNGAGMFSNDVPGAGSSHAGHVSISTQGTNVQLSQFGLVLDPNTKYSLSFKAYSNTGHDLSVSLLKNVAPYANYGLSNYVVDLGTSWSEYSVQFTTSGFSSTVNDGRLMFWLAPYDDAADHYYFDDVILAKVTQETQVSPTIITQPTNKTITAGQTAIFSVAATGTSPLTYQWKKNGINITSATGPSYTTPIVNLSDNGTKFSVLVSNAYGSVTSNEATLTVTSTTLPPSITAQPENTTVSNGSAAIFSVAATGTAPLTYQWKKNSVNITSATGPSYTTPIVNLSDNGTKFSVLVSNAYGSITSNQATLTVITTPPSSILSNPGFESGVAPWSFYTNGAGTFSNDASGVVSPHAGHVTISAPGTNVQLSQFGLVLDPNTRYSLTFKAYSNTGHDLSISLLKNVAPYTNYGLSNYVVDLGTSWSEYSVQFTTSGFSTTVNDGRLMFWLAPYDAAADHYYFDDFVLMKLS